MSYSSPSRRDLLKAAGCAAAGAALPAWFVEETLDAAELRPPKSANDKPNIALIGCGGRGRADAHESLPFGNIVAVCDVDEGHAQGAAVDFPGAKPYHDFRKVLERDDIPIIITATPDHWHTLVNLHALQAGKDIYTEKPLTLTIDEGKRLVAAVKKSSRIVQVGSQQRSDPRFRLACELVRNGRIGKLQDVQVVLPAGHRAGPFPSQPAPQGLDWDFWLGQAPKVSFAPQRCFESFRFWYDYSGGTMTDWGAHHNDIARWGIGADGPLSANGKALSQPIPGGYTAHADYHVEYTWPNGVRSTCLSTQDDEWTGSPKGKNPKPLHNGVTFKGTDGWIFVTRGKLTASNPDFLTQPLPASAHRLYVSNDHKGNFFECVRTRKQPVAPVEVGHRSVSVCHLGVLSIRLGRKLEWDPQKERFVNDPEADKWLTRPMRKPWSDETV
ncbi:MAG TPA: Gfo/Idh/MocA family oxidoreductase [Tepidisphaeraceae bacterium]|nr:Gfo/Idh/MocA family oxidoreductase [Tepidisphaeraceae bacterium]